MTSINPGHMRMAQDAARRSNCIRRAVGAIIVRDDLVLATGWNGVSAAYRDCGEAGCLRCLEGGSTGSGYDQCMCIHAEQRAIADAAARGVATKNSVLYVNLRPCLQCLNLVSAARVRGVVFDEDWAYSPQLEGSYQAIAAKFEFFEALAVPVG